MSQSVSRINTESTRPDKKLTFCASVRNERIVVAGIQNDGNTMRGHIRRELVQECHRPITDTRHQLASSNT